jgi:hypothetical protein
MLLDRLLTPALGVAATSLAALTLAFWLQLQDAKRANAALQADIAITTAAHATQRAAWADERAALAAAAQQATDRARAIETDWRSRHDQIQADTTAQLAAAHRDAAAALSTGDRLRDHVRALAQQCSAPGPAAAARDPAAPATAANPAPARPGPPTPDPGLVLADLLSRMDAAGRELAAVADARGTAGQACQRAYDALTAPRQPAAAPAQPGLGPPH